MRHRRVAVAAILAWSPAVAGLGAAPPASVPEADELRLGRQVVPTSQEIRLELDPRRHDYGGSVRIDLRVLEPVTSFRLHAQEMDLVRIALEGPAGPVSVSHETGPIGLLAVSASRPLEAGAYTLTIDFENDFGTRAVGLYRMEQEGAAYAFTQLESDDAREAFPCWDEPAFKIPYRITLRVPEADTAITNTPVERETVEAGTRTVVFARTRPLPSYLLAIATGPLETIPIAGMTAPGRVVTVKGRSHLAATAARTTPPLLAAAEAYFGGPYPFEKLDLIAIPEYWPGAMENPGAITYADTILLIDPEAASLAQRRTLAAVTAHELAHMWFGDLVTMAWWDDLWLNESFADWMGAKLTARVHPEYEIELSELRGAQAVMKGDARPSAQAIRRSVRASDNLMENLGAAYAKGSAVLTMFERWMGHGTFRSGVLDYLRSHAWGNAEAADLWSALAKASGADVAAAMATFLEQPGLPLVRVEPLPDGRVKVSQRRFATYGVDAPPQRWRIPVVLKYPDGREARTRAVLLEEETQVVDLGLSGPPAWVLPHAEATGYYRWSVPPAWLEALAGVASRGLEPAERIGFIDNAAALLAAGEIGGDRYLEVLAGFASDEHPQVAATLASALEDVREPLVVEGMEEAFARYLRRALGPALDRIGLAPAPAGEAESVTLARPALMLLLGVEGRDERLRAHAGERARAYLLDPRAVDPSVAGVILQLAAVGGDRGLLDRYRRKAEAATVPAERSRLLSALGWFRDPDLVEEVLRYALAGPLRAREMFQVTGGIGRTAAGRARLFRHVTENYDVIAPRLPEEFAASLPRYAGGCEPERVEAARRFFGEPARDKPGTRTALRKVSDQVAECVGLRTREAPAVAAFLKQAAGGGRPTTAAPRLR